MLHVVDIHTPDPESSVRSPAEGRIQEVTATMAYESGGK
ncbi:DUF5431 family protein [Escherichia coli]